MRHGHFAHYMRSCFWCRCEDYASRFAWAIGKPFRAIRRFIEGGR